VGVGVGVDVDVDAMLICVLYIGSVVVWWKMKSADFNNVCASTVNL